MDPYMFATYNYKYNQYLHSGCTAEVAAKEALRSVRSFYGAKANNQELLNYANRLINPSVNPHLPNSTFPPSNVSTGYQYNPHYGMVPAQMTNIYYGSHGNIDTTAIYNQCILNQTNIINNNSALLSGISIKPPAPQLVNPQSANNLTVPIHPLQFKQSSTVNNNSNLPIDVNPNNINNKNMIIDWVHKIFSVHVTENCSKNWKKTVSNFVNAKIDYWKTHNINPTKLDLVIPSADVIEKFSAQHESNLKNSQLSNIASSNNTNTSSNNKIINSTTMDMDKKETKKADKKNNSMSLDKTSRSNMDSFIDIDTIGTKNSLNDMSLLKKRAERFTKCTSIPTREMIFNQSIDKLIGTSTEMEKQYLRLTGPPNPALVRPLSVLKISFIHIIDKYKNTLNYRYIQEQFRSIRQDMKVQQINDLFATHVYETNARIALLNCDLDQFNQCQTQLIDLHSINQVPLENVVEFKCYRLLYLSLQNTKMDLLRYLRELNSNEDKSLKKYYSVIDYANRIRRIVEDENYYRYFSLLDDDVERVQRDLNDIYSLATHKTKIKVPKNNIVDPPFFSRYIFKMFNQKFRVLYLLTMAKTSMVINPKTVYMQFKFTDIDQFKSFLNELNIVWTDSGCIDSKKSLPIILESKFFKSKKIEL